MVQAPKIDMPDGATEATWMKWVDFVNQQEPLSEDAQIAIDILLKHIGGYPRSLRAFWHEDYGHWWVHPTGDPGHQVGSVMQIEVDRFRAERQAA